MYVCLKSQDFIVKCKWEAGGMEGCNVVTYEQNLKTMLTF